MATVKLGVALYGNNGHQIAHALHNHSQATLIGYAEMPLASLHQSQQNNPAVKMYSSLDEILSDKTVDIVSLCSPRRSEQAAQAIACLQAGKHVYAEKPSALYEHDLDAIIETAQKTGCHFHEMADTFLGQPFYTMRAAIKNGMIGTVVQVIAQKSYPYHDGRPQDESVDGGLLLQVGVHAARFIEHVAGVKIVECNAIETALGNPKDGDLKMACVMNAALENGGVGVLTANYLRKRTGAAPWGGDQLRVFGTTGILDNLPGEESVIFTDSNGITKSLDPVIPPKGFFEYVIDSINGVDKMPFSLEDELHPTRVMIRVKNTI